MSTIQNPARMVLIDETYAGQRIDNFLLNLLKGLPKSRLYRILRKGEVRVNKKRVKPEYRLQTDDAVRIPPMMLGVPPTKLTPPKQQLELIKECIVWDQAGLVIINKPSGIAVHGGSGVSFGVIEVLRALRPHTKSVELVHRLDRATSGCLMLATKRSVLKEMHELLREQKVEKTYLALVMGKWEGGARTVDVPLLKNQLSSGERIVKVHEAGKQAITEFMPLRYFKNATLVKVRLQTGRTHQIRVHAAHIGHPIAGDDKYGDHEFNKQMRQAGLKRLFLHAASLVFALPETKEKMGVCATLDAELIGCLNRLAPH